MSEHNIISGSSLLTELERKGALALLLKDKLILIRDKALVKGEFIDVIILSHTIAFFYDYLKEAAKSIEILKELDKEKIDAKAT